MIVACLDLSTAHLERGTMRMLTELNADQRMGNGWPAMTVANYQHGVFVSVPERTAETKEQLENVPPDLGFVLGHAQNYGIALLRFDSDGDELPDLDVYHW